VNLMKEYQPHGLARSSAYFILLLVCFFSANAQAATFSVNTNNDTADSDLFDGRCETAITGTCSLRAAIQQANALGGNDTIILPAGRYVLQGLDNEDFSRNGDLDIREDLTIIGFSSDTTSIDTKGLDRIFDIHDANNVSLKGITLINGNSKNKDGGAIRFARAGISGVLPVYKLEDIVIRNSNAGLASGGAVYIGMNSSVELSRVVIDSNTAQDGGAIYSLTASLSFQDSKITNNRATRNGGGVASFGRMNSIATIFNNNVAEGSGGGIIAKGDLLIDQGEVSDNRATGQISQSGNGGGIWLTNPGNVFINTLKVYNNQAGRSGGGLLLSNRFESGKVSLNNVTLKNNQAQDSGGAIEGFNVSSITNSNIIENHSTTRGGGLTLYNTPNFQTRLTANIIACNQTNNTGTLLNRNALGGGLYGSSGQLIIENTTLYSNRVSANTGRAIGGGIFLLGRAGDTALINNTTVAYNSSDEFGANISSRYYSGSTDIINSIVSNPLLSTNCFGSLTSGGHNIDSDNSCGLTHTSDRYLDPLLQVVFTGTNTIVTGLQSQSPAIDRGNDLQCPDTDQRLHSRNDAQCDIGSLEAQSSPVNAGQITFSLPENTASESDGIVSLFVDRVGGSEGEVTISYIMSPINHDELSGHGFADAMQQLMWADGDIGQKTIDININNDTLYESDEYVQISLVNPIGGAIVGPIPQTTLVVLNDDALLPSQISMEITSSNVTEGRGTLLVNLVRNSAFPLHEVSVDIDIANSSASLGKDYTLSNDVVVFPAGVVRQSLLVELLDDVLYEGRETISLTLTNPRGGAVVTNALKTMTINIDDNETRPGQGVIAFTAASIDIPENTSAAQFSIQRSLGTRGTLSVDYIVTGGSASQDVDYILQSGTALFSDSVTHINVPFTIIDDALIEGMESINLELLNVEGGGSLGTQRTLTITIIDDEQVVTNPGVVQFALAENTVTEDAGILALSVTRTDGLDGAISVDYRILGGTATLMSDYIFAEGTVTFNDQEQQKSLMLSITDDRAVESTETIILSLSNPSGGAALGNPRTHTITIQDNDAPVSVKDDLIQFQLRNTTTSETRGFIEVNVERTPGMTTSASVDVVVSGGTATFGLDYLLYEGTLRFSPGINVIAVPLEVFDDFDVERNETIILTLKSPQGSTIGLQSNTVVTIIDNDIAF